MELDDRKVKILKAIIKNYLETGEPVGSRTISKYADLKLSSATIRNEMADLEELGYIVQPHTSAGRIPTDKGYRFYVDDMMSQKETELVNREQVVTDREKEVESMQGILSQKVDKVEELLQNVAKVLAKDTNYATMVSAPQVKGNKLKFVQLSQLETNKILAVIVMEGNIIRNKVITVSEDLSQENLLKLNILLNTSLTGLSLQEMNLSIVSKMENQAGEHMQLVKEVVDAIVETISGEDNLKIYTSGATNIFKYPELSDSTKASELIYALEEKQSLTDFVKDTESDNSDNTGIQVYIGNEAPVESMKDCSVVTATYELQDGMRGTIGIIGPKRMDYDKVVEKLKTIQNQLDDVFKKSQERLDIKVSKKEKDLKKKDEKLEKDIDKTEKKDAETVEAQADNADADNTASDAEAAGDTDNDKSDNKKKDPRDAVIDELQDRVKRQMAEFDNYRKRTDKEKSAMFEMGASDVIKKLLPIVDNFERGFKAITDEEKETPFAKGMDMVYKQTMKMLEDLEVKPIEAVGLEFNPDVHNAVMHVEDDSVGEGIVVEEFEKGYTYRDTVIRHSMVKVANQLDFE